MKLSPDSTLPIIFLMTCLELFNFITARPADIPKGKIDLHVLILDMRRLMKMINHGNMEDNFKHKLTALPSKNYSAEDLKSLEMSSTLAELSSDLKNFKFHLDWVQKKEEEEEVENDSFKTKKLVHLIQHLIRQIGKTPEPVHPSLPPLKTSWNLYQANVEIHNRLFHFCNWYIRALGVLKHRQSHNTGSS